MRRLWLLGLLLSGCATAAEAKKAPSAPLGPISMEVDLTEAPRRLLHAKLVIPVQPGPLTLAYPQWIPGEHGPSGPLSDLANLVLEAGGKRLAWRRDDVEMYELKLEVPAGAKELSVSLDFLSPPAAGDGFYSAGSSISAELAVMNWNQLMLLPKNSDAHTQPMKPSLVLPAGWSYATPLTTSSKAALEGGKGARVVFEPTTWELLFDSPVLAGTHVVETPLGSLDGAPMSIAVAADTEGEGKLTEEQTGWLKNLVREEQALFGARHFDHYVFLLSLSDALTHFGLEHHQASDDRLGGRTLLDRERAVYDLGELLAHESVHSWNGKYRRPQGLATGDYQTPMKGELLWIYEGLTEYLGRVLAARCGSWTLEEAHDDWALVAEEMRNSRGRTWRPLGDTATEAQVLYEARKDGAARRRSVDFYPEGQLIWLEADVLIREKTGGKASLDDFIKAFHGGKSGPPAVVPYTLDDVVKALDKIAPNDWKAFFDQRINQTSEDAPLGGLTHAGWKLDYGTTQGPLYKTSAKVREVTDLTSSLGFAMSSEKMVVSDVVPGKPADQAGMGPGMKLLGVNGRKITAERLEQAINESPKTGKLELVAENAEALRTFVLEYKDGAKFPRLVRIEGTPDLLSEILKAHAR